MPFCLKKYFYFHKYYYKGYKNFFQIIIRNKILSETETECFSVAFFVYCDVCDVKTKK